MDPNAGPKPMERRSCRRIPCGISLRVNAPDFGIQAELMDISPDGMFIKAGAASMMEAFQLATLLSHDATLVLRLRLINQSGPCEATGRLAYRSDLGFGIEFQHVTGALLDFIQRLGDADDTGAPALLASITSDSRLEVQRPALRR